MVVGEVRYAKLNDAVNNLWEELNLRMGLYSTEAYWYLLIKLYIWEILHSINIQRNFQIKDTLEPVHLFFIGG